MLTIIVFFTALTGIIILFFYKLIVISKRDSEQQIEHSTLKVLPNTYHVILHTISTIVLPATHSVFSLVCSSVIKTNKCLYQKCVCVIQNIKLDREDPGTVIEKKGVTSVYIKEILEQKKIIQAKNQNSRKQNS
ncbi:hypothetical protein KJ973_03465 [Patescibacteria group bacterium]|nr:hypothetical protein [Patescibacteria group bacterium]MBU1246395.1 hypothetical protein [Patescibacteria group bacterium]MBU1519721.1 hypothetical protein [Patescibacteria group bacterium]MBU1730295.1 hypothetical protein [Patescibacteria group bacterium]MBU1956461.1 hypothetical protein [Patescibacteria group bacterium]